MGRSHFSFDGERKVCKRKPAARRLREKALYCPFLKEGVRNVARRIVGEITPAFERARAHSFPLSKRARLFPSAAYRRPRPRGRRKAYASLAGWEVLSRLSAFAVPGIKGPALSERAWGMLKACRLGCFDAAWIFLQRKMPAWFQIHAGIFTQAMRPVAEWR